MSRLPPPDIPSEEAYCGCFTDPVFWQPYVEEVCHRHGLGGSDLQAGYPGTEPVFLLNDRWVVKFFGPYFGEQRTFPIERETYRLLSENPVVPAPALAASGELFPEADWPWPYLVLTLLPGVSVREARSRLSHANLEEMAAFTGRTLKTLHRLKLPENGLLAADWNPFLEFLQRSRERCVENHRQWGILPGPLIEQLEHFLPPISALVDTCQPPVLLHADLHEDHLLGTVQNGSWRPEGIIDFGDARVGDPLYDFVVVHLDLFLANPALLQTCLRQYGIGEPFLRRFPHSAMAYTLLHEYNVLEGLDEIQPRAREANSLEELQEILWGGVPIL